MTSAAESALGTSDRVTRPLDDVIARELMRVRVEQSAIIAPVVIISLVAISFALRDRVNSSQLYAWAAIMASTILGRSVVCAFLWRRIRTASRALLTRYERAVFVGAVLNAVAIGLCFWMVAANGDFVVKLVVTLLSCFYGIGSVVSASSHFPSFVIVSAINLGQGVLFWLGIGSDNPPQFEVAVPYLAVSLMIIGFARTNSRQFAESLAIRTENLALLEQLAQEKRLAERALDEARIASESKSRFLAAASHDLRQPLHALTMFLGTLTFHVTTDDAKRLLGRVKDTTDVLREQFDSLLDLSKFDAGAVQPDLSSFDLATLARKLIEEMRPEAEARKLAIFAAVDAATARSDAVLVERVLRNLLANAVKYTTSGAVTVRARRQDAEILVEVIDTGPGIAPDEQGRIFEEYVQLANPARQRRHGVGLGLAIVKRIDSLLGLRLTLQSSVGAGTVFSFHVPASDEVFVESVPGELIPTDYRTSATIWVLDDDTTILEGFKEQLSAWGARVEVFCDPQTMIARLRAASDLPRWIFTDDMLGTALSGLETAQMLSTEFGFGRVCLVTGNTEPARLAQLRSSGFPVIVKPARPEELIAVLRTATEPEVV